MKYLIAIISGLVVAGVMYAGFVYLPEYINKPESQLATINEPIAQSNQEDILEDIQEDVQVQENIQIQQENTNQELEQAKQETERAEAETERLRVEQEAERLAEEQRRQQIEKEFEEYMSEVNRKYLLEIIDITIEGFEYLKNSLDNGIVLTDKRLKRLKELENKVRINQDLEPLANLVELYQGWPEFYLEIFQEKRQTIQETIDYLKHNRRDVMLSQEIITKADVYEWRKEMDSAEELFNIHWDNLSKWIKDYNSEIKEDNESLDESFNRVSSYYDSQTYQYSVPQNYQDYYTSSVQNWLDNTYKQRQLETLQSINNNLFRIQQELTY